MPAARSALIATVPNTLSILRLGAAAAFPFVPDAWRLPLVLFAGLSDFADGLIARRYGATSFLGGVLDVAGDKLFTLSAVAVYVAGGALAWWQALLLLARDLTIATVASAVILRHGPSGLRRLRPSPLGKATTLGLFVLFITLAAGWTAWPALLAAAALSVGAAVDYVRRMWVRPAAGPAAA